MIKRFKKKETLSDKIFGILSTAPVSFDPEDDIYVETTAKVTENDVESEDDEVELSKFRKQNAELLEEVDTRYVGKKGTRKSLKDSDEDWSTEDEGLSVDEGEALDGVEGSQEIPSGDDDSNEEEEEGDSNEEEEEDESESDGGMLNDTVVDEKEQTEVKFKHLSESNASTHATKGNSVRNQLNMWESLLEIRIQLQKCLVQSNKLPQHEDFKSFRSDENFKTECTKSKKTMKNVLDKFLTLQLLLLKQYPETKTLLTDKKIKNKEENDEEILSDTEDEKSEDSEEENIPKKRQKTSDMEHEIKTRHNKYTNYRNNVIQKWNDKTRLNIAKNNTQVNSVIQHINFILEDKQKLVKRTQLKRSEYEILGKIKGDDEKVDATSEEAPQEQNAKSPEEYDTEIFDDDDFYHQLLRELIEFKSAGITDPIQMSRQWIQLQNLRSKMKRKIDTRATKGRKIRYAIHSKLVNFMAPIDYCVMTQEARNELYSSLFGKKL